MKKQESNLVAFAREELRIAGMVPTPPPSMLDRFLVWSKLKQKPEFDYDGAIAASVLDLVALFAEQGHSGFSGSCTLSAAKKLMNFEPLSPLTGEASEWNQIGGDAWQNRRCGRVFKDADGRSYDIDGRVFADADGHHYTCRESRVYVDFPYTPTTEYVEYQGARA